MTTREQDRVVIPVGRGSHVDVTEIVKQARQEAYLFALTEAANVVSFSRASLDEEIGVPRTPEVLAALAHISDKIQKLRERKL